MSTNFNFVQITSGAGSVSAQTFPANVTKGDAIIAYVVGGTPSGARGPCIDITDGQGNQYWLIQQDFFGYDTIYAAIAQKTGSLTVTNNIGGSAFIAAEYSSAASAWICPGSVWDYDGGSDFGTANTNFQGNPTSPVPFSSGAECRVVWGRFVNGGGGTWNASQGSVLFQGQQQVPTVNFYTYAFGDDDESSLSTSYSNAVLNSVWAGDGGGAALILNLTGGRSGCLKWGITISCGNPPGAILGSPYLHLFPVSGGTFPYVFSITSGSLPPGLTLDISSGGVSGIPSELGTYNFGIDVTDSNSNVAGPISCSITVSLGGPWIIQEVETEMEPGGPQFGPNAGRNRYTVRCINASQIGSYLQYWKNLGGGSGSITSVGGGGTYAPESPPSPPSLGAPPSYTGVFSATQDIPVTITHNLNLPNKGQLIVQVFGGSPMINWVPQKISPIDGNNLQLTFGESVSGVVNIMGIGVSA